MPNLVGVVDARASEPALSRDLARMMDIVDLPAFGMLRRSRIDRGIAVGNVLPGIEANLSQPVEREGVWLMLDGEILGIERLERDLLRANRDLRGLDDAGLALEAYLAFGERFVEHLNGAWNLVIHHPAEGLTLLVSDRFGSRILFYAEDGPRFVFASEMKAVVKGRDRESRAGGYGLFELLSGPYQLGELTWIDGVRVLDPGTVLRVQGGRVERRRYWRFGFHEGGPLMSEDEYARGFAEQLSAAVRRYTRRSPEQALAITLSGGLDSRAIALSLEGEDRRITAFTYGDEDSADVRYARQLAGVIGLDFRYVEADKMALFDAAARTLDEILGPPRLKRRGFYSAQMDRQVWRDECLGDMSGTTSMIWHPLYSRHMNLMLQGAAGDALTGSHLPLWQMRGPSRVEVIRRLMESTYYQSRENLELILNPELVAAFWPERERMFARTFANIEADEPSAVAGAWDLENRQRRGAFSTFTMERYFATIRTPFLDYELVDHLRSVPRDWRFMQRVYKKMIVEHHPEAAHVPWAYTEGRITTSPSFELAREWARWARRRVGRIFEKGPKAPSYAFRDTGALIHGDPELWTAVEDWLASDLFDAAVFNREGMRTIRDRLWAGDTREEVYVPYTYCCALARAHRYLFGGLDTVPPEADPARFGVRPAPRRPA